MQQRLQNFTALSASADKIAAVALIIVEEGFGGELAGLPKHTTWQSAPALLLTVRARHLRRHAGQWALPGGRVDPNETDFQAAVRETQEEVNLNLSSKDYLGRLDDYVTRSGFVMKPHVFWASNSKELKANPNEVGSIHRIPTQELLRKDAPLLDYQELATGTEKTTPHPVLRMPIGDGWIAAPTAAILFQFREVCLLGNNTRVSHYEQPEFAWR